MSDLLIAAVRQLRYTHTGRGLIVLALLVLVGRLAPHLRSRRSGMGAAAVALVVSLSGAIVLALIAGTPIGRPLIEQAGAAAVWSWVYWLATGRSAGALVPNRRMVN